ncbi:uncharacterized protein LOC110466661 [Mizuhopecten yessoensis]|uniref:Uncharacterized protein n=1 Tax=Mizuhopecten yessoensis TaxID=6573 RepID=A0A210PNR4_MIZYE|nr:uncharacterized protein LOC110466661 [Mizuhopecten yessoensis]OWF38132.1 hypothetical protein KP79_PYT08840 [Mizuhopecten yessoensis]
MPILLDLNIIVKYTSVLKYWNWIEIYESIMVHTTEVDVTVCQSNAIDRCLDGIDINNSCRQVYLRRMESIEECKRSTKTDTKKATSTIDAALMKLRTEMVDLMDQDAGLMRQMLILNEKVEELKANNICQMSKESLDSRESLYEVDENAHKLFTQSKDSLYFSDEQTDESLFDSNESLYNMKKQTSELVGNSVDSLYQSDEFSSDEENVIGDIKKSVRKTDLLPDIVSYDFLFEKLLDFDDKI